MWYKICVYHLQNLHFYIQMNMNYMKYLTSRCEELHHFTLGLKLTTLLLMISL